ncbi:hypothetical protein HGB07_10025 [Candidatus Roizmanbacteria bacterium]|nr:hypothetical protein [Candidatus Roizmanbacteria bacterium]
MEQLKEETNRTISIKGREASADELGCNVSDIQVVDVDGGYSRNRRSLVGYADRWIFAKEVDHDLLPSYGAEELGWIQKDCECVNALIGIVPELVPEWEKIVADGHVLLMPSYRVEDGWSWSLPEDENEQQKYIQAVVDAVKKLENIEFDQNAVNSLNLHPYFRDKLALDDGLALIIQNEEIRSQLENKYAEMAQNESLIKLRPAIRKMQSLLLDERALNDLSIQAASLINQPNDCFGHCDVRSDNIAYNSITGQVKFVDWNWASFTPKGFGVTEFLIDMSRHGADVTPWLDDLNTETLAAVVGLYAKRCLKDPLSSGNILRDVQAQSGAVSLDLYERATERKKS